MYWGADKSLARPGRKQTRKYVRVARDFNNIETRAVMKFFFFFLKSKAPKEIHAILTERLDCFLPGRAKALSALLYVTRVLTLWSLAFIKSIDKQLDPTCYQVQAVPVMSDGRLTKNTAIVKLFAMCITQNTKVHCVVLGFKLELILI